MCGPASPAVWPDTFGEWYTRAYRIVLCRVRKRQHCRPELAEDATQDAAKEINDNKYTLSFPCYLPFYVYFEVAAQNRAIRLLQQQGRGPSPMDAFRLDVMLGQVPADENERQDLLDRLMECLKQLKPFDRGLLWLYYFAGMTQEELGECFELSVPTIRTRLRQAELRLRQKFLDR